MSKVRKSIILSFGQNYVGLVLQFFSSVIIARLLAPHEIGIFSVAIVLIGFAHTLRDFGSATYVIQEKELTLDKIRSAFAITLIISWIMAATIGLGSGYAAEFYREPGIRSVMLVLSLNFFLIPFGSVPIAYMHRQMDFKHISLISIISQTLSVVASIGLAYAGFSYLSMALGSVSGTVCTILLVQVWRPKGLPFLPGFREIRKVFSFGSLSSFVMILNDICIGAPDLILGRLSGMSAVAYFGRATGLVSMFEKLVMKALWSVAVPHFAEQFRAGGALRETYLRSMTYVSVLAWPFFVNLGLQAHPIILILYGRQWEASAPLLQLLCISMLLTSPFLLMSSMMTAIGQMKQNLYALFVRLPIRVILVLLAAPYGLKAVGITFIISALVDMIVDYFQSRAVVEVNLRAVVMALHESVAVTFASAVLPLFFYLFADGNHLWLQLFLGIVSALLGWIAGLFLFKHPLRIEISHTFSMLRAYIGSLKFL